ncbi:MAG TPA: DMT family transporter [Pseudorhodoplanes sp.]|jgi:drug/metabolite transporter (DMT)-like permease|nr:DMT family transporter [Pseudorhodoplanes sp.]
MSANRAALAGIGLMLLGIFLFSANDALGKWILGTYGVGQMLLIRGTAALLMLSPFIYREGLGSFRSAPRLGLQILRLVLATAEVVMFFWAVRYLPLADIVTFYMAGPIYVTALSALFLGEKVGWRRWTAVVVGFIGVLIALRPSPATFTLPALIALTGSSSYALLMIVTRYLRGTSDIVMATGQIVMTLLFGAATASAGWVTPTSLDLFLMAWLGVIATLALMCVNRSLKLAPASVVVPYQYTMILWAVIFGYAVFGDRPQPHTLIGAAIIVAAGLYIFWREQRTGAKKQSVVNPP